MIEILHYSDEAVEQPLLPTIESAYAEVARLLETPETIGIYFTDDGAGDETGVGGFTYAKNRINLAFAKDFTDKATQLQNLRSTVYHESFHVRQGFTYTDSPFTALESAIYEGCAVIFERDYAEHTPLYADYQAHSESELKAWLTAIKEVGDEYFKDSETWYRWAFYHEELNQRWIIYKIGTWLVDNMLHDNNLSVLDLQDKTATQIIELGKY